MTSRHERKGEQKGDVGAGIVLGIGTHCVGQPLLWLAIYLYELWGGRVFEPGVGALFIASALNVGLTQFAYLPLVAGFLLWRRRSRTLQGVLIVSGILLATNGLCWAVVASTF